jgi:hypothetical protein
LITSTNESVYGLWNTTAGGGSTLSTPGNGSGNYNPNEPPQNGFDQNVTTKHSSFGICNSTFSDPPVCGIDVGVYLTPGL